MVLGGQEKQAEQVVGSSAAPVHTNTGQARVQAAAGAAAARSGLSGLICWPRCWDCLVWCDPTTAEKILIRVGRLAGSCGTNTRNTGPTALQSMLPPLLLTYNVSHFWSISGFPHEGPGTVLTSDFQM